MASLLPGLARSAEPPRAFSSLTAEVPFSPPTGEITLAQAVSAALLGSPLLPPSALEIRAREAQALQAGLLPNPTLQTEVEDFGGASDRSGFNASQTTVSLAQLIELGGKRAKRVRLAEAESDVASWDYETRRLEVLASVAAAFIETLVAQERVALGRELLEIAEKSVATVAGTVRSGAASPLEQRRAGVAASQVQIVLEQQARALEEARIALASTWGSISPTFSAVVGSFPVVRKPPSLDALIAHVERNPDLARWSAELDARGAAVSLAKAQAVPDVTVSAGGRYYQDDQSGGVVLLFSVPLNIFNRNQGGILEAERRLEKTRKERTAAELTVRSQLARIYQVHLAAYTQALALKESTLPQAEDVFRAATDAYSRGVLRYIEVLDAQRTLFELRAAYLDALSAYHISATEIARLTGDTLELGETSREREEP